MIKVELSEEEWMRLLNAAALAPYAQIAFLIQKVGSQVQASRQPEQAKPESDQ